MMKQAIIGVTAVGALVALRPVAKRMVPTMREHCKQMMGQCAGRTEAAGPEAMDPEAMRQKMREHCGQMAAQHAERSEPVTTA